MHVFHAFAIFVRAPAQHGDAGFSVSHREGATEDQESASESKQATWKEKQIRNHKRSESRTADLQGVTISPFDMYGETFRYQNDFFEPQHIEGIRFSSNFI